MGGAEMQIQMLLTRLRQQGHFEIHYVTRNVTPTYNSEGYFLHRIPARRAISGTFILDIPSVIGLLNDIRPDVIYQRVGCIYTGLAARYAVRRHGRMVWHVAHDRDLTPLPWRRSWRAPFEQLNRASIEYAARHADTIVVQNREQRMLLQHHFGRYDGIQIRNFHPTPQGAQTKPSDIVTVCWIANVKKFKRPSLFVQLAEDFKDRADMRFVMIGAPPTVWGEWSQTLERINHLPNLQYLGAQSQEEVNAFLATAHILVNTSTLEGFPNTFIQAWLRQTAVASMSANPDGVFDNQLYGVCANDNYQELRRAVELLARDVTLRDDMVKRALTFARTNFSERNIDYLIDVLETPPPFTAEK
jgi:glycosyltransferase involved in cell wall biosynthesis